MSEDLKAEVARLEAENTELRKLLDDYTREYPLECNKRVKAEAERDSLAAVIAEAKAALNDKAWGPTRDKAIEARKILSADPSEVLRSRDEKIWDQAIAASHEFVLRRGQFSERTLRVLGEMTRPYRVEGGDGSLAEGLRQSAAGEVVSLGSFAQFAGDEEYGHITEEEASDER